MARYRCPQCGRRFGSVGEMLTHTEQVHANATPYAESGARSSVPARGMPAPEPGPVATERASQTGFETERAPADDIGTFERGPMEAGGHGPTETGGEGEQQKQGPALGTLITIAVIILIIILNIIGGGSPE